MAELIDSYNRKIDYLRLSITDRCNLRCFYCMPDDGVKWKAHDEILTYEEIELFARAAVAAGVSKIRLTGGEPLVRKDVLDLVRMLAGIEGLRDMSLTTNATRLADFADKLFEAGLRRVNLSIDSLDPSIYRTLTRGGEVQRAVRGLERALELGLDPVKVNVVLIRGISDDPADFVRLTFDYPVHVRFIEFMPVGSENEWRRELFVPVAEISEKLGRYGKLEPVEGPRGAGPASYLRFDGAQGTIGLISPVSRHFCASCNRLRLTPDGRLRTCLLSDAEFDVRSLLRAGAGESEIIDFITTVLREKPREHNLAKANKLGRLMSQIGG